MRSMNWTNRTLLRRAVVALVMLALSLAGIGRGLAAAGGSGPPLIAIGGFVMSLCHTDDGGGHAGDPLNGAPHDCCDQCTLCAAADMPIVPPFAPPARIVHFIEFGARVTEAPAPARLRTPRLSQGPPNA